MVSARPDWSDNGFPMNDPDDYFEKVSAVLGPEAVDITEETIVRYGENTLPTGDTRPSGILYPGSTGEVQTIVRLANEAGVQLWPVSTGNNQGFGTKSPVRAGQVVMDLGRRMNRILEVDDTLCFARLEPGVSYQRLYEELVRRGNRLMLDTTSGPPEGGIVGNTLDRGAGFTPYFDHFYMSCGLEVVLGNGEILRTGDGALPGSRAWNVSKYTFGPDLSGLFLQSNYGIVTRMGVWLMPRPAVIKSFHFSFPDDDDIADIIELCRPLKLTNVVPTLFRVCSDVYLFGSQERHPEYAQTRGRSTLSDGARKALREKYGIGAWVVSGAFYGAAEEAVNAQVERVRAHFCRAGKARPIAHEDATLWPPLQVAICAFSGIPTATELGLLNWRPGGGNTWLLAGMPMTGKVAGEHHAESRRILAQYGFEYCTMIVCGARFARELIALSFNREDPEERMRADRAYRALADMFASRGYAVGRAATGYQQFHMEMLEPVFRSHVDALKNVFDPGAVIAPGKYGIGKAETNG